MRHSFFTLEVQNVYIFVRMEQQLNKEEDGFLATGSVLEISKAVLEESS